MIKINWNRKKPKINSEFNSNIRRIIVECSKDIEEENILFYY